MGNEHGQAARLSTSRTGRKSHPGKIVSNQDCNPEVLISRSACDVVELWTGPSSHIMLLSIQVLRDASKAHSSSRLRMMPPPHSLAAFHHPTRLPTSPSRLHPPTHRLLRRSLYLKSKSKEARSEIRSCRNGPVSRLHLLTPRVRPKIRRIPSDRREGRGKDQERATTQLRNIWKTRTAFPIIH
jgi:hypothetical protein